MENVKTIYTVGTKRASYYVDKYHDDRFVLCADDKIIKSFTSYESALEFLCNRLADIIK